MKRSGSLFTVSGAAFLLVLGGVADPVAGQAAQEGLSDARVMELARGYVEQYTGAEGRPVRLTIGLVNDGSIGGMTARPVQ